MRKQKWIKLIGAVFLFAGVASLGFVLGNQSVFAQDEESTVYYGVDIDEDTGDVSGFAWSETIGWIDFDNVTYDSASGDLTGAAEIVRLNNEGVDGSVSMNGSCGTSCTYGVTVESDGTISGSAWSEYIGWIRFQPDGYGGVSHDNTATPSVSGWAWNDNIGWIKMSEPAPPPGEGACEASPHNTCLWAWNDHIGWISHNSTDDPSTAEFGVDLDVAAETVTGHAWNDHLQYIDFSNATFDASTGEFGGTAQIEGLSSGNTVSLRGDCNPSCGGYGVNLEADDTLSGYAWNDTIGWIDFAPGSGGGVEYIEDQEPSLTGWAWNDNYGWISFRFTEYDVEYGLDVELTGAVTGYAWSRVGWIDYDPEGPYPASPQHDAQWDPDTGEVSGWAKFVAMENNGYDGWIRLRNDSGSYPYGVSIDPAGGGWSGFAWNEVAGWIQYDHAFGSVVSNLASEETPTPDLLEPLECVDTYELYPGSALTPALDWTDYASLDDTTQQAFQVQVDNDPDFSSPVVDETVNSSDSIYTVGLGVLEYNVTYYWRARQQNSNDEWTEWGEEGPQGENNCFRTPAHAAPQCDFTMDPEQPVVDDQTEFTDETQTYGGATIDTWSWNFGDGETTSGSDPNIYQNPVHTYDEEIENLQVTLEVTDSDGYECSTTNETSVGLQLPEFRRVIPR